MALCPRCNKRQAKRRCPALLAEICATCCASERMTELACPESCTFLRAARVESRDREADLRAKEAAAGGPLDLGMNQRSMAAAYAIDLAIVEASRDSNDSFISGLNDLEALSAVENAIKNLETEETGLIYEHPAASPRVEQLSRRIRESVERVFEQESADAQPRRSEVIRALKYIRDAVKAHTLRPKPDSRSYIRYISLFCPFPQDEAERLIV